MIFTKLKTKIQINLILQCIGMLIGTTTHVLWIINHVFFSAEYNVGFLSILFWDSLTFLDPIAAVLLISRPKAGIWMTAIIIVADVLHNGILCFSVLLSTDVPVLSWAKNEWMFWIQLFFGLFVIATFKGNLIALKINRFRKI